MDGLFGAGPGNSLVDVTYCDECGRETCPEEPCLSLCVCHLPDDEDE